MRKMFNVGRYDPKKQQQKAQEGKSKSDANNKNAAHHRPENKKRKHPSETGANVEDYGAAAQQQTKKTSTLRVIAPDESAQKTKKKKKERSHTESLTKKHQPAVVAEAIDDLDLLLVDPEDSVGDALVENNEPKDEAKFQDAAAAKPNNNETTDVTKELERALKWSKRPLAEAANAWKLAPFLIQKLQQQPQYTHFFPVQAWAISQVLWQYASVLRQQEQDMCITAPTGSGK